MGLLFFLMLVLHTVLARVRNIDCDHFAQNCVPCLAAGECFCRSQSDFINLRCNKRIGERKGCFEIFNPENQTFSCNLLTMSVRKIEDDAIQLCRNFSNADELLNIHATRETALDAPQFNKTILEDEIRQMIETATLTLVIALVVVVSVFMIITVIAVEMLHLRSRTPTDEKTQNSKPEVTQCTVEEKKMYEDDGLYECVNNFHRDLELN